MCSINVSCCHYLPSTVLWSDFPKVSTCSRSLDLNIKEVTLLGDGAVRAVEIPWMVIAACTEKIFNS